MHIKRLIPVGATTLVVASVIPNAALADEPDNIFRSGTPGLGSTFGPVT